MKTIDRTPLTLGQRLWVSKINKNFIIRITPDGFLLGSAKPKLLGAGQLYKYIGWKMTLQLFDKAISSPLDKYTVKLRRGFKIEFISK